MGFLNKSAEGRTAEINGREVTIDSVSVGLGTAEITMPDGSTKIVSSDQLKVK